MSSAAETIDFFDNDQPNLSLVEGQQTPDEIEAGQELAQPAIIETVKANFDLGLEQTMQLRKLGFAVVYSAR